MQVIKEGREPSKKEKEREEELAQSQERTKEGGPSAKSPEQERALSTDLL